jgi:hypothetical protein
MSPAEKKPRVFISYSRDYEQHCTWVRHFAEQLVDYGLNVRLDQWHAYPGISLPQLMEQEVASADYIVAICTPQFARKGNARTGGAGYEQQIVTGQLIRGKLKNRVIPVLRSGDFDTAIPTFLRGTLAIDLRDDAMLASAAEDIARIARGRPRYAPPIPVSVPKLTTQTRTPLSGFSPRALTSSRDAGRKKTKPAATRGQRTARQSTPTLSGDYTSIRIPIPPASAFNKDRPAGLLLQAQLRHFHHAESARLPKEKRDGRRPEEMKTEAEAAAYIAKITKLLHPQRRPESRPPASS